MYISAYVAVNFYWGELTGYIVWTDLPYFGYFSILYIHITESGADSTVVQTL